MSTSGSFYTDGDNTTTGVVEDNDVLPSDGNSVAPSSFYIGGNQVLEGTVESNDVVTGGSPSGNPSSFYTDGNNTTTGEVESNDVAPTTGNNAAPSSFYRAGTKYATLIDEDELTASIDASIAAGQAHMDAAIATAEAEIDADLADSQAARDAAAASAAAAAATLAAMSPATTDPLMDGAASVGALTTYARGDHRHPTDTTRAAADSPQFTGSSHWAYGTVGAGGWYDTTTDTNRFFVGTSNASDEWRVWAQGAGINAINVNSGTGAVSINGAFSVAGYATAATPPVGDNSTKLATTGFIAAYSVRADIDQGLSDPSRTTAQRNSGIGTARNRSGVDCNTLTETGLYDGNGFINGPPGTDWYYIDVFRHSGWSLTSTWVRQTAYSLTDDNPRMYVRVQQSNGTPGGIWSPWQQVLTANNNLSEVTSAATARSNIGAVNKAGDTMTGGLAAPSLETNGGGLYMHGWGGDPNVSVIFMNNTQTHYIYHDGTNFSFNGGGTVSAGNGRLWGSNDFNYTPVNKAGDGMTGDLTITSGSLYLHGFSGDPNKGIIRLNTASDRYLYWDGSNYNLAGAHLYTAAGRVYGTSDGNPLFTYGGTMSGAILTPESQGITTAGGVGTLEVGGAAWNGNWALMTFHVHGQFATNFGLSNNGNFYFGGWSHGGNFWQFWTKRDFGSQPMINVRLALLGDPQYSNNGLNEPYSGGVITGASGVYFSGTTIQHRFRQLQMQGGVDGVWYAAGYV